MVRAVRLLVAVTVGVLVLAVSVVVGSVPADAVDTHGASFTTPKLVSVSPSLVVGVVTTMTFTATVKNRAVTADDDFVFTFPSSVGADDVDITDTTPKPSRDNVCLFQANVSDCPMFAAAIGDKLVFTIQTYAKAPGVAAFTESTCVFCRGDGSFYNTDTVSSAVWTEVAAQSVSAPTLAVRPSLAAGATEVTYDLGFTTSGRGALTYDERAGDDGTITITFPSGTFFDDFAATPPSGPNRAWGWNPCVENQLVVTCSLAYGTVPARTRIDLPITGMVNPVAGTYRLTVSTSTDTVVVKTPAYTTVAMKSVLSPTVALTPSNAAGGATGMLLTLRLSSSGGLGVGSLITFGLTGDEPNRDVGGTVSDKGAQIGTCGGDETTAGCGFTGGASPGDTLTIALTGTFFATAGTYPVTISTTSDTNPVTVNAKVNNARPVSNVEVTELNNAPATRTDYQIAFAASSQGGMSAGYGSQVTVTYPAGTVFNESVIVSTGSLVDVTQGNLTISTCDFDTADLVEYCNDFVHAVHAGDHLVVHGNAIDNPAVGEYQLQVTTTSDGAKAVSQLYYMTGSVSSASVTLDPTTAAGGLSHYRIAFTVSPTGELIGANNDFIVLDFSNGTGLGGDFSDSTVTDLAESEAGTPVGTCVAFVSPFVICTITPGADVRPDDQLAIDLGGVYNPPAGSYTIDVSTSEDQDVVTSQSYTTTTAGHVGGVTVAVGPATAAGATSTYAITLTPSAGGGLSPAAHSSVVIQFPTGTGLSGIGTASITSSGSPVGTCAATSTTLLTCPITAPVSGGTPLSLILSGVVNPPAGAQALGVQTTSDPAGYIPGVFSTSTPAAVSNPTVSVTGWTKHGLAGTYAISFLPSDGGAVGPGGTVTITFPAGTDLSAVRTGVISDAGENEGGACIGNVTVLTCTVTGFLSPDDLITVTVKQIVNPPAGTYQLGIVTSSDPISASTPSYVIK